MPHPRQSLLQSEASTKPLSGLSKNTKSVSRPSGTLATSGACRQHSTSVPLFSGHWYPQTKRHRRPNPFLRRRRHLCPLTKLPPRNWKKAHLVLHLLRRLLPRASALSPRSKGRAEVHRLVARLLLPRALAAALRPPPPSKTPEPT